MTELISTQDFRALFEHDAEFAVIDPRESSDFAAGHLLAASSLPLSRLAATIGQAVPQTDILCALTDNGGGEAVPAGQQLRRLGYDRLAILDGGVAAWEASGGSVFSGTGVPAKAFGEFVRKFSATPVMNAAELYRRRQRNNASLLIDARSAEQHESYCIPGAVFCPGAELIYRVLPVLNADTEIVVHCGDRTRSIIGAQTLIEAGCNHVYALENGTMGWQFEGLELEHGNRESLPLPDSRSLILTRAIADQWAERWHINRIDSIAVHAQRSRYLIDVRSREEFEAGHIPGTLHIPGGHLLQNVEHYLAVRNSVVVLIDSDWVRAVTTAVWLRRMGWRRVYVFTIESGHEPLETGAGTQIEMPQQRNLDPNDYADQDALMRENRAYLEWEIALIDRLPGDPAAPYMEI